MLSRLFSRTSFSLINSLYLITPVINIINELTIRTANSNLSITLANGAFTPDFIERSRFFSESSDICWSVTVRLAEADPSAFSVSDLSVHINIIFLYFIISVG